MGADPFRHVTREGVARGIAFMSAAGDYDHIPLLRGVGDGRIALVHVSDRQGRLSIPELQRLRRPTLLLIGDDDYLATGPNGWACAKVAARWCRSAIVHGSGADPSFYAGAVNTAAALWRLLVVETASDKITAWAELLKDKPALLIRPRGGASHPVLPSAGAQH